MEDKDRKTIDGQESPEARKARLESIKKGERMATINQLDWSGPEQAKAKHGHMVIRIQDELERLLKIGSHLRECMENEMFEGVGYKKMGVPPGMMKDFRELAGIMKDVTHALVQFNKAQKALADSMSKSEEKEAVKKYIKAMEPGERKEFLRDIREWAETRADFAPKT